MLKRRKRIGNVGLCRLFRGESSLLALLSLSGCFACLVPRGVPSGAPLVNVVPPLVNVSWNNLSLPTAEGS